MSAKGCITLFQCYNFGTECQIFTVVIVQKILVFLGNKSEARPGRPHCFTIFTGLLGDIIIKYPNKRAG